MISLPKICGKESLPYFCKSLYNAVAFQFFLEEIMRSQKFIFPILCAITFAPYFLFSGDCGVVVAFAGLSGSGKTTMAKALATLYSYHSILEPEESEWPYVIRRRDVFGTFTMWMGFRQLWIPFQYEAQRLKNLNQTVILDSYFIKIVGLELGEDGMEWLFHKDDPYYTAYYQICQLDIEHLPDPDCIVLFDVSYDTWIKLLSSRNRDWDKTPGFLQSYSQTKKTIAKAVESLCRKRNIKLISFQPEFGDIIQEAARLHEMLLKEKIFATTPSSSMPSKEEE